MAAIVTDCIALASSIQTLVNKPWRAGLLDGLPRGGIISRGVRPLGWPATHYPPHESA